MRRGQYRFDALDEIRLADGPRTIWKAQDALVLKAMAMVLTESLKPHLSKNCVHVKSHGGAKQAVRKIAQNLQPGQFVMRSDVKGYYASIDHFILMQQFCDWVDDRSVRLLFWQHLKRVITLGGTYRDVEKGLSLGYPLSPLMGALYLSPMDKAVEKLGLFYVRYMDDWLIIAPTRWKLRKAVKVVNEMLASLKVQQHPDKTFIGKAERGFDFLGYAFKPGTLSVAKATLERARQKAHRLYEQGADVLSVGGYWRRFWRWVVSGIGNVTRFMHGMFFLLCLSPYFVCPSFVWKLC